MNGRKLNQPLGGNAIRRDIPEAEARRLAVLLRRSIEAARAHRRDALEHALPYARGLDRDRTARFVDMYVNELTCDYGDEGRRAVEELLRRGEAIGAFPEPVRLDYIG